jgi:hypothetical protein
MRANATWPVAVLAGVAGVLTAVLAEVLVSVLLFSFGVLEFEDGRTIAPDGGTLGALVVLTVGVRLVAAVAVYAVVAWRGRLLLPWSWLLVAGAVLALAPPALIPLVLVTWIVVARYVPGRPRLEPSAERA